jgi:hypothetical protein
LAVKRKVVKQEEAEEKEDLTDVMTEEAEKGEMKGEAAVDMDNAGMAAAAGNAPTPVLTFNF